MVSIPRVLLHPPLRCAAVPGVTGRRNQLTRDVVYRRGRVPADESGFDLFQA